MKRKLVVAICTALGIVCVGGAFGAEVLVWRDEFDGERLDPLKWTAETGLVRNDRAAQIYRDDARHLSVSGGSLNLTATYSAEGYANPYLGKRSDWRGTTTHKAYASAAVNSFGKLSMRYGRVEVRARFSVASGAWPAIWMLGSTQAIPADVDDPETFWQTAASITWPQCGEIDIMEYATRDADDAATATAARKNIHATFHWGDAWSGALYKYSGNTLAREGLDTTDLSDPESGWHTYGLTWTPETLTITCDGEIVHSMSSAEMINPETGCLPFRENAFHLILNLALGSMSNDPPADGTGYPITHAIDYVRIWQNPETVGNQLIIGGKDRTFAGFASNDENARPLLPESATLQADGAVNIVDTPMVIGGFEPTKQVTLTLDVSIPEDATGTIAGIKSGDGHHLRFVREADGTATCRYDGDAQTVDSSCTMPPGRHTIRIAYDTNRPVRSGTALDSATSGTRVWVDDALAYVSPSLIWAQTTVPYVTIGGDASDTLGTPMNGLRVHAVTLTCGEVPNRFVCSDTAGAVIVPNSITRSEDGSLVVSTSPLEANGFTETAALTVTMDAEVPENATGTLIGLRLHRDSDEASFTVSADCAGEAEDPLRYDGTTEHKDTVVYGRPSAGRHLYRLTHSTASGTQFWEDDTLLASAPGIKWTGAAAVAATFGGSAESPAQRPLTGLKVYAVKVDTATATPEADPLEDLFIWPENLEVADFKVRHHLATIAADADGVIHVPEMRLNGKPLDTISAARALWFYGLTNATDVQLEVGEVTLREDGGIDFTLNNSAMQTQGTLAILGTDRLDGGWMRLATIPSPIALGAILTLSSENIKSCSFFKIRAEETANPVGPAASIQEVSTPVAEGMPIAQRPKGTTPLFTFTFSGISADLGSEARDTLTLFLSGSGLLLDSDYTLTIGNTSYSAPLQEDGNGATLTFSGLPNLADGTTLTLAGPIVPGEVSLCDTSWGEATGRTRIAAVLASDLIEDGFVPATTTLSDHFYRIPAVATDGEGEVVAIYDVRYGGGDLGDSKNSGIDLGESYSMDYGIRWGAPTLAVDVPNLRSPDGTVNMPITPEKDIGDAAILYDPKAERYWLMAITGGGLSAAGSGSEQNDCVLYTRERGIGANWKAWTGGPEGSPRSVKTMLLEGIGKAASPGHGILEGPGHGIVTTIARDGMPAGTLVFPMQAFVNSGLGDAQCFAAYSTDGGATWQTTGLTPATLRETPHNAQENCILELDDGSWLMMAKGGSWGAGNGRRLFFRTTDFRTWKQLASVPNVIHVQGSCLRLGKGKDGVGRYVFAHQIDPSTRAKLALIFGHDITSSNSTADTEGVAWDMNNPYMLHSEATGGMGYVSLCLLDRTTLGVLYEAYGKILFERIDITPWLEANQ